MSYISEYIKEILKQIRENGGKKIEVTPFIERKEK